MSATPITEGPNHKELILRWALYGGLGGSLGATLGWFVFVGLQTLPEVLLAVAIGVVLGLLILGFEHYRKVAVTEVSGAGVSDVVAHLPSQSAGDETADPGSASAQPRYATAAGMGAIVALILALVCENIAAELINEFFKPFTASLVTLFPIGAFLSLVFRGAWLLRMQTKGDDSPLAYLGPRILLGPLLGAMAGVVAIAFYFLMDATFAFNTQAGALISWWALIGLGFALASMDYFESSRIAPLIGVLLALALIFIVSTIYLPKEVPYLRTTVGPMADQMLAAPDLPARFWNEAEEKRKEENRQQEQAQSTAEHNRGEQPPSSGTVSSGVVSKPTDWNWLARCLGCDNIQAPPPPPPPPYVPHITTLPTPTPTPRPIYVLPTPTPHPATILLSTPTPISQGYGLPSSVPPESHAIPVPAPKADPFVERKRRFCENLQQGWQSKLARSWLVMIGFALGLGWGRYYEPRWRPVNYRASRTCAYDNRLAVIVAVFMLLAILLLR